MMEYSSSSKTSSTPLKKSDSVQSDQLSNDKDVYKFRSEKGLVLASTVAYSHIKRRIQFSQRKSSEFENTGPDQKLKSKAQSNPQKKQSSNSNKQLQTSASQVIEKTHKLTNIFYPLKNQQQFEGVQQQNKIKLSQFNQELRQNIIKILKQLKYRSKQLVSHLNTVYYCSPSIRILQPSQIQKQILKQWRDNILLTSIRSQWYVCIQKFLPLFGKQAYFIFQQILYENFCQFMSRITYIVFKGFFQTQISKKNKTKESIIRSLSGQTIRYILTQSSLWQNTVYLIIQGMLQQICPKIEVFQANTRSCLLKSMISQMKLKQMRTLMQQLNSQGEKLFPQTKQAFSRFTSKIKSIINIRVALQQDILTYQKKLIEQELIKQFQMFQKDEILTCITLSILSGNVCLKTLYTNLKEVKLILGAQTQRILGIHKCPSYFVDLEAAVEFLIFETNRFAEQSKQKNM